MTTKLNFRSVLHLYSRAGFGLLYNEAEKLQGKSKDELTKILFSDALSYTDLNIINETDLPKKKELKSLGETEKKKLQQLSRDYHQKLNIAWLKKMQDTKNALREKMTFFWHGHFACRSKNPVMSQQLNNIHRKNALGNFRDMVIEVSKSPAMLEFLDNQQNRKAHPNENFARELMELFTLGRGNYTEQDIRESARAFTGWAFNRETYQFEFKERQHDFASKTFLGRTGNFNGEDIIDIILNKKETAQFICRKIYKFFVNDSPDEERVAELADNFYKSNYNIGSLMKEIFTSDWFYDEENIGTKIKSPVEFIVNLNKLFDVKYEEENRLIYIQRILGQILFFPPNVAGWSGGKNWIDSNTLMLRLKIPSVILNEGIIETDYEYENEEQYKMIEKQREKIKKEIGRKVKTNVNWDAFVNSLPPEISQQQLTDFLLLPDLSTKKMKLLSPFKKENLKAITLQLLSFPEYQMC